ncbi:MAG: MFS transporter [Burkholderiaceae bacterium]|jgi:MFS family permease|uniref:MFS transporter n=1 Tax=Cupriavidus metallidurans TaxID=119219 RepID=A0A482IXG0_9BURK|nr:MULTISPECIES: MFS transporter [Cupriavidus]KWR71491.1 MFS transporter [Cupriavidus sp. SHE]PCH57460.1 MAG: MFS transporter [Burkholderiaceae bacterium]QBP13775.1 MFS transporter [Cupriavidus metallidurans]QWC91548.1 MFS transporter [Cupriavidus metallidurans]
MSTAPAQAADEPQTVFRDPAFRHFWFARLCTTIAYQIFTVAVGWQMYDLTRDPFMLGMVGLVQFLPSIVLLLMSGHVADRFDRRIVVRTCQVLEALIAASMAVASFSGWVTSEHIFLFVAAIGGCRAFETPTLQALLPSVVTSRQLPRAVALSSSAGQTAIIIGPALGGFAYVAGPGVVYSISAALFAIAAVLVTTLKLRQAAQRMTAQASLKTLFAGFAYIRSHQVLLGAVSLDLFAVLLGGATALLPIYARDILHTGPWGLGLLRSAPAIGALTTALWLARNPLNRRVGRVMFTAVAIFGLATMVFGVSKWLPLSMAALVVLGASDMISVVVRQTLVQLDTPDDMRGRVGAVNSVFIGASNQLGEFESGVTAALLGPVGAVLLGGVGTLIVVVTWMRLFPNLTERDRLHDHHPAKAS